MSAMLLKTRLDAIIASSVLISGRITKRHLAEIVIRESTKFAILDEYSGLTMISGHIVALGQSAGCTCGNCMSVLYNDDDGVRRIVIVNTVK